MKVYLIRISDELACEGYDGVERIFLTEERAKEVLGKEYKPDRIHCCSYYIEEWEVEE